MILLISYTLTSFRVTGAKPHFTLRFQQPIISILILQARAITATQASILSSDALGPIVGSLGFNIKINDSHI